MAPGLTKAAPRMCQWFAQNAHRIPQNGFRIAKDHPEIKDCPKVRQGLPRDCSGWPQDCPGYCPKDCPKMISEWPQPKYCSGYRRMALGSPRIHPECPKDCPKMAPGLRRMAPGVSRMQPECVKDCARMLPGWFQDSSGWPRVAQNAHRMSERFLQDAPRIALSA